MAEQNASKRGRQRTRFRTVHFRCRRGAKRKSRTFFFSNKNRTLCVFYQKSLPWKAIDGAAWRSTKIYTDFLVSFSFSSHAAFFSSAWLSWFFFRLLIALAWFGFVICFCLQFLVPGLDMDLLGSILGTMQKPPSAAISKERQAAKSEFCVF